MAYIQERKNADGKTHYRVQIRLKGYPITTATFERKTDAKLWAQQTEAAMREDRYFKTSEAKKYTLGELIDRYIENVIPTKPRNAPACTAQLKWWKEQIGHCLLSDLTPALIVEQREKLLKAITFKGTLRFPFNSCPLLGVGAEMMWAKVHKLPIITLAPKNSHYHISNTTLLDGFKRLGPPLCRIFERCHSRESTRGSNMDQTLYV